MSVLVTGIHVLRTWLDQRRRWPGDPTRAKATPFMGEGRASGHANLSVSEIFRIGLANSTVAAATLGCVQAGIGALHQ